MIQHKISQFTFLIVIGSLVLAGVPARANDDSELLSEHETIAVFQGISYRVCQGRTAACPYRCGGTGNFAIFRITKYLRHSLPSSFGQGKVTEFVCQINDNMGQKKVPEAVFSKIASLKPGQGVSLSWKQEYVTKHFPGGATTKMPKVSITKLEANG